MPQVPVEYQLASFTLTRHEDQLARDKVLEIYKMFNQKTPEAIRRGMENLQHLMDTNAITFQYRRA